MVMYGCKMYDDLQRGNVEHTVVRRTSTGLQQYAKMNREK
jgi:hypothetical protein